jgi:hypothetical protein
MWTTWPLAKLPQLQVNGCITSPAEFVCQQGCHALLLVYSTAVLLQDWSVAFLPELRELVYAAARDFAARCMHQAVLIFNQAVAPLRVVMRCNY